VRGDVLLYTGQTFVEGFQSTPLREGRLYMNPATDIPDLFQSTPLREGRLCWLAFTKLSIEFQSTPLREGRLFLLFNRYRSTQVSIHAPA